MDLSKRSFRRQAMSWLSILACIAAISGIWTATARAQSLAERFSSFDAASETRIDNSAWSKILTTYVKRDETGLNRIDYAGIKANALPALSGYLALLQRVKPEQLSRAEQFAFWVNLYNAKTVEVVASHFPVRSIRDIRLGGLFRAGPWRAKIVTVNGIQLSLDDIEHDILRRIWRDPRIHYAVNCASIGCPNLRIRPFVAEKLEATLDQAAREYINSPRGVSFNGEDVSVSRIYDWFSSDFGGSKRAVLDHIRQYASPQLKKKLGRSTRITGYAYDWNVNGAK